MIKIINKYYIYMYILLGLVIFLELIFIFMNNNSNSFNNYNLVLAGYNNYLIKEGDDYIEPGYHLYDSDGNDLSNLVQISGDVDTSKEGEYVITYKYNNLIKKRIITVVKNDEFDEEKLQFELVGDDSIIMRLGTEYNELGFKALYDNEDISNYVEIYKEINTLEVGEYKIVYTLNYLNVEKQLVRNIIVKNYDLKLNIDWENDKYVNDFLEVNIKIEGDDFNYILLPDGTKQNKKEFVYQIKDNGEYQFIAYNNQDEKYEKSININLFDKIVDSADCLVNVYRKRSEIIINAKDNLSGIKKYQYNNLDYDNNTIRIDSRLSKADVKVFDNLENIKEVSCSIKEIEKEAYGFILVGDSRFADRVGIKRHVGKNIRKNDTIIALGGMGYNWLEKTAYKEVNKILKKYPDRTYYIMTNLGFNDYGDTKKMAKYVSLLNKLAEGDWKGHYLGFISVNPYMSNNLNDSRNKYITNFNKKMKSELKGYYYCDTYNGIGYKNFKSNDKVHYTKETDTEIYNYIISKCNF